MYRRIIFIIVVIVLSSFAGIAQSNSINLSADEIASYQEQSKMMISYLEGTLNFLGDPEEVISEKEIIINHSYLKVFLDAEVQIEDDLDENRDVPLRKDVQAYLKDVMFFYKQVKFELEVSSSDQIINDKGDIVFKLSVNRKLIGITVNNDTVENNLLRFIEINLDPYKKDLRIASMYTTKPNAKEEMRYWWNNLPLPWKDFMGVKMLVFDTLPMNNVASFNDSLAVIMKSKSMVETDSLLISNGDTLRFSKLRELDSGSYQIVYSYDTILEKYPDTVKANISELDSYLKTIFNTRFLKISNNYLIQTLEPLSRLNKLEKVIITNMLVSDIAPLRNLNKLLELDISSTMVTNLEPLRFSFNLQELNISKTEVSSLQALKGLTLLDKLIIDSTKVVDLSPLSSLNNLSYLSLCNTQITNLAAIGKLQDLKRLIMDGSSVTNLTPMHESPSLEYINIDNTDVTDLAPLSSVPTLKTIQANNSAIHTLKPFEGNTTLRRIYCDHTGIERDEALAFMEDHPKCLVIFDSQRLVNWWNGVPEAWKTILSEGSKISNPPTKEELQKIVIRKEVSISNNQEVKTLAPLTMLFKLERLDISNTAINDLSPLFESNNLRYLNLDNTPVAELESLSELSNLIEIHFENTNVSGLRPLVKSKNLELIYCDGSNISTSEVISFKTSNPECLVVFQTEDLTFWWNNLSDAWQAELLNQIKIDGDPTREELQQIIDLKEVAIIKNSKIIDLEPLSIFHFLRNLSISFTAVSDLSPLAECDSIRVLNLPNNPVVDIEPIAKLIYLEELNLENTGVNDLAPLAGLLQLHKLNLAGTKIKKLKPLSGLTALEELTINNTKVNRLTDVNKLGTLKKLTCYNTSIKKKKVDVYKTTHPEVEVIFY